MIKSAFEKGKAFIPFITCGDPDTETTEKILKEAYLNGADLIELGIPFSDPTAEGPVIQSANTRALKNGVTTDGIFAMVERIRGDIKMPLVFMTYANVVYAYGADRFTRRCAETGIEGIILPDVPFEEKGEFSSVCEKNGVDLISLIAPTSKKRISMIAGEAKGFIYVVSSLGVTGERKSIDTDLKPIIDTIRENTNVPCAVGFGISNPEQVAGMAAISDGAIVGSAIIKIIEKYGKDSPAHVGEFVKKMADAVHGTKDPAA